MSLTNATNQELDCSRDSATSDGTDQSLTSPFDAIRRFDDDGNEFWSARDMMSVLNYPRWREFVTVIGNAKTACAKAGDRPEDHFGDNPKLIEHGKGGLRQIPDVRMDRLACYHLAIAGDPSKQGVADARNYFLIQARKQEKREAEERQNLGVSKTALAAQRKNGMDDQWLETRDQTVAVNRPPDPLSAGSRCHSAGWLGSWVICLARGDNVTAELPENCGLAPRNTTSGMATGEANDPRVDSEVEGRRWSDGGADLQRVVQ